MYCNVILFLTTVHMFKRFFECINTPFTRHDCTIGFQLSLCHPTMGCPLNFSAPLYIVSQCPHRLRDHHPHHSCRHHSSCAQSFEQVARVASVPQS